MAKEIAAQFERVCWDDIAPHVGDACAEDEAEIRREVITGVAQAWRINAGEAHMICREEQCELVVMVFQGRNLRAIAPDIIALAHAAKYRSIRFHTQRPGMIRMLEIFGFFEAERVYRMVI